MSDDLAPVPIADGTVRRLFDDPEFRVAKRGYHPDDVARFLDDLGTRMVNLIGRLQVAEKTAETARGELDDCRLRAEQAESSRELFDRTLVLAEETANASVADAKHRSARIEADAQQDARRMVDETRLRIERMMDAARADVQRAYADERQTIADTQTRIQSENDQLETLRLAVAAETMALEEVRNELRRRIRRAATDLLGVAESPDCLGTPVTRGVPEVIARQSRARVEQETSVPEAGDAPAVTEATEPAATTTMPAIAAPGSLEGAPTAASRAVTGAPPPPPPEDQAAAAQAVDAGEQTGSIDLVEPTEEQGADDDVTVVADEKPTAPADPEDAFDRFMSDEIEEEPSRTWILA
jgi:DivIVA domain-containing protein